MIMQEVTAFFGAGFKAIYQNIMAGNSKGMQYIRYALIAFIIIIGAALSFILYRWYSVARERAAQKVFTSYVAEFEQASKPGDYAQAAATFKRGYDKYSGSNLGPYFKAFQADALIKEGKKDEALGQLSMAIDAMPSSSPFYSLYKTKRALLQLDMSGEDVQKKGLEELSQLAQDKKNQNNDVARFYLGLYYFAQDNMDQAKKAWQQLVDESKDMHYSSPWAQEAQQRLEAIA